VVAEDKVHGREILHFARAGSGDTHYSLCLPQNQRSLAAGIFKFEMGANGVDILDIREQEQCEVHPSGVLRSVYWSVF